MRLFYNAFPICAAVVRNLGNRRPGRLDDNAQLFASKYRLILPTKDALRQEIECERGAIEVAQSLREEPG